MKKSKLSVITYTKKLNNYILLITMKCPSKYRYTYVTKMHNLAMEILECLYFANSYELVNPLRKEYQDKVKIKLKMLDSVCDFAYEGKCINMSQYENISKNINEINKVLIAWIDSDLTRKNKEIK